MHPRLVCEHGTFEMLVGATYLLIEAQRSELEACESCQMALACLWDSLALAWEGLAGTNTQLPRKAATGQNVPSWYVHTP